MNEQRRKELLGKLEEEIAKERFSLVGMDYMEGRMLLAFMNAGMKAAMGKVLTPTDIILTRDALTAYPKQAQALAAKLGALGEALHQRGEGVQEVAYLGLSEALNSILDRFMKEGGE